MSHTETAHFTACPFRDGWFLIVLDGDDRVEAPSAEWEQVARALERGMARKLEHVHVGQVGGATYVDAASGPNKGLRVTLVAGQAKALARQIRQTMIRTLMPKAPAKAAEPN